MLISQPHLVSYLVSLLAPQCNLCIPGILHCEPSIETKRINQTAPVKEYETIGIWKKILERFWMKAISQSFLPYLSLLNLQWIPVGHWSLFWHHQIPLCCLQDRHSTWKPVDSHISYSSTSTRTGKVDCLWVSQYLSGLKPLITPLLYCCYYVTRCLQLLIFNGYNTADIYKSDD